MKTQKYFYLFLIPLFIGCVNLKLVNDYANTSIKAIDGYKANEFSFKSLCKRECEIKNLNERISNDFKPLEAPLTCDCKERAKADEAISKILFGLTSYLESVQKLSNDGVTSFKFDNLADALDKTDFINVDTKEINAYKNLLELTSKIIFDAKRQKALQINISKADEPFSELVEKLASIIDNQLMEALDTQKKLENNEYKILLKESGSLNEKITIEKNYLEEINAIEIKKARLQKYSGILKSIKEGHNKMKENGAKLDSKNLIEQLSSYFTSIKKLKTEFDNLKSEK